MDRAADGLELLGPWKLWVQYVILASGHPTLRFAFGEHDRIKLLPVERLDPDDSRPPCSRRSSLDPGLERLRLQIQCQRGRLGKARRGLDLESARPSRASRRAARQLADLIVLVLIKLPACDRGRRLRAAMDSPGFLAARSPRAYSSMAVSQRWSVAIRRRDAWTSGSNGPTPWHAVPDPRQGGDDPVVIDLANWVELVIMAASAVDRQPRGRFGRRC